MFFLTFLKMFKKNVFSNIFFSVERVLRVCANLAELMMFCALLLVQRVIQPIAKFSNPDANSIESKTP